MNLRLDPLPLARRAAVPALCIAIMLYFILHAVTGPSGFLAWGGYKAERARLSAEVARIEAERAGLEHRVELLDPRRVDPDLADELVRKQLGVARPDEVVVPLPESR